jgi:hypothetical protein
MKDKLSWIVYNERNWHPVEANGEQAITFEP